MPNTHARRLNEAKRFIRKPNRWASAIRNAAGFANEGDRENSLITLNYTVRSKTRPRPLPRFGPPRLIRKHLFPSESDGRACPDSRAGNLHGPVYKKCNYRQKPKICELKGGSSNRCTPRLSRIAADGIFLSSQFKLSKLTGLAIVVPKESIS